MTGSPASADHRARGPEYLTRPVATTEPPCSRRGTAHRTSNTTQLRRAIGLHGGLALAILLLALPVLVLTLARSRGGAGRAEGSGRVGILGIGP
jgi:hypothetical protein